MSPDYHVRESITSNLITTIQTTPTDIINVDEFLEIIKPLTKDPNMKVVQNVYIMVKTLISNLDQNTTLYVHQLVQTALSLYSDTRKFVRQFGNEILTQLLKSLSPTAVLAEMVRNLNNATLQVSLQALEYIEYLIQYNVVPSALMTQFTFYLDNSLGSPHIQLQLAAAKFLDSLSFRDPTTANNIISQFKPESISAMEKGKNTPVDVKRRSVVSTKDGFLTMNGRLTLNRPKFNRASTSHVDPKDIALAGADDTVEIPPEGFEFQSVKLGTFQESNDNKNDSHIPETITEEVPPKIMEIPKSPKREIPKLLSPEILKTQKRPPPFSATKFTEKTSKPFLSRSVEPNMMSEMTNPDENRIQPPAKLPEPEYIKEPIIIKSDKEKSFDIGHNDFAKTVPINIGVIPSFENENPPKDETPIEDNDLIVQPVHSYHKHKDKSNKYQQERLALSRSIRARNTLSTDSTPQIVLNNEPVPEPIIVEETPSEIPKEVHKSPKKEQKFSKSATVTVGDQTIPSRSSFGAKKPAKRQNSSSKISSSSFGAKRFEDLIEKLHSEEWSDQNDAILEFQTRLDDFADKLNDTARDVVTPLAECGLSLRTALAKNALSLLLIMIKDPRIDCASVGETAGTSLLKIVSAGRQFISAIACDCFDALVDCMNTSRASAMLIAESKRKQDKSRIRVASCIGIVAKKVPDDINLKKVCETLTNDANQEVRRMARMSLEFFY